MTIPREQKTEQHPLMKLALGAYQQVAALIATFALIAFFSHFYDFEWRGFVNTLVAQWSEYVRPAVGWLLDLLITKPLAWIGWHVDVPVIVRDYLAVGLITVFSLVRELRRLSDGSLRSALMPWEQGWDPFGLLMWPPLVLLVWPISVAALIFLAIRRERHTELAPVAFILAPLVYFGALVLVNYLLL